MTPEQKKGLRDFYNRLADRPLTPDDPYYEPFLKNAAGDGDPIARLATGISWSEAASVNLLSGQRGSGKSTELRRLKADLEAEGCVVFLCDMRDYMNLTQPIEISDFFISVMAGLSEEVEKKFGEDPAAIGFWERLVAFLKTEVQIKDINIESAVGPAKAGITASLKDDPDFKKSLQKSLRGHVAHLVRQAHEFSTEVVALVHRRTGDADKKVVLLLDSQEQIRGVGEEAKSVYEGVANLFSGHVDKLQLPHLHVVYTIPPYLTLLTPHIGKFLGSGPVYCLASVHVFKPNGDSDSEGLSVMERIIANRQENWKDFFTVSLLHDLARASGGDLRDFFRLIRDCLITAATGQTSELPIRKEVGTIAKNHLRRNMLPIARDDLRILKRIAKSQEPELNTSDDLYSLAHFFDSSLVLNYRNGDDWYGVHPLLVEMIEARSDSNTDTES